MTLTEFLLARIAEDAAVARAATQGPWRVESIQTYPPKPVSIWVAGGGFESTLVADCHESPNAAGNLGHIAAWSPARVLAECEAKRRIVELHGDNDADAACQSYAGNWSYEPCDTLTALALPYADHPDYREEWKP